MNSSVTHTWRKANIKSDFRIICTKMLIKFYYFILPNIMHNQTSNTVRGGVAVEKNQDQKGKGQNFIINYEH